MITKENTLRYLSLADAYTALAEQEEQLARDVEVSHFRAVPMTERRFPPPWSVEEFDACFQQRTDSSAISISSTSRAADQQPSYLAKMRRGGSRRSCQNCCAERSPDVRY
jgi:hypothetical protein